MGYAEGYGVMKPPARRLRRRVTSKIFAAGGSFRTDIPKKVWHALLGEVKPSFYLVEWSLFTDNTVYIRLVKGEGN